MIDDGESRGYATGFVSELYMELMCPSIIQEEQIGSALDYEQ